jgi:preprotein translocase subunit SecE
VPGEELFHDEEPAQAPGTAGVEEALPALQQAHAAQGNEVGMASIIARTRDFTAEVTDELKKVTWPDAAQLKNATFIIIVFVLIVSAIIFVMDFGVRNVLRLIMNIFAAQ